MVEPPAAVVLGPVGRAIAPPSEVPFGRRDEVAADIDPAMRLLETGSASTSTGVWLTTVSRALWFQTSHSRGATLKSPTMTVGSASALGPAGHSFEEVGFCPNFRLTVLSGVSPPAGT